MSQNLNELNIVLNVILGTSKTITETSKLINKHYEQVSNYLTTFDRSFKDLNVLKNEDQQITLVNETLTYIVDKINSAINDKGTLLSNSIVVESGIVRYYNDAFKDLTTVKGNDYNEFISVTINLVDDLSKLVDPDDTRLILNHVQGPLTDSVQKLRNVIDLEKNSNQDLISQMIVTIDSLEALLTVILSIETAQDVNLDVLKKLLAKD